MEKRKNLFVHLYSILIIILMLLFLFVFSFLILLRNQTSKISYSFKREIFLSAQTTDNYFVLEPMYIEANIFFPDSIFDDKYTKALWIEKLNAFFKAYKNNFVKVVFQYYKSTYNVIFYNYKGEYFYFTDGKILPASELPNINKYNYFIHHYPKGITNKKRGILFPKPINYSLLSFVYGKSRNQIQNNLKQLIIFDRRIFFNNKNGAYQALKESIKEIQKESSNNNKIKKWIQHLKTISSFSWRSISNDDRKSLHSYGIAIDFIPYGNKAIYWNWSNKFVREWWNIPINEIANVPNRVVKIFEKHGFVWGGKWFFFDYMHFEYRPEIKYYKLIAY